MAIADIIFRYMDEANLSSMLNEDLDAYWEEMDRIKNFISYFFGENLAFSEVIDKKTLKKVPVKIMRTFDKLDRQHIAIWADTPECPCLITAMIDVLKKRQDGIISSPLREPRGITKSLDPTLFHYVNPSGAIYLESLSESNKKFAGAGRLIFQTFVEISGLEGRNWKVIAKPILNSPGFYRKMFMTTGSQEIDDAIDKENELAKTNGREPDNEERSGNFMSLSSEGIAKWRAIIEKNPLLKI